MRPGQKRSLVFNFYTISAVYFLILVGGIVRAMGAGMGCPDWPKCFGSYIPPSDEASLPDDYKELFVEARVAKNARLASTLEAFGWAGLAAKVKNDPSVFETTSFDFQKAWVEYVNRLIGVLIGFLIILNMFFSFSFRKDSVWIPVLGVLSFILVVFQGWVGSLVVSTNLLPGFISFHMMLALLLVALLLVQRFISNPEAVRQRPLGRWWIAVLLILFTVQVFMGTQVREEIDLIKSIGLQKTEWINSLGSLFYVHRSFSLLIVAIFGCLFYLNFKNKQVTGSIWLLGAIISIEILLGAIMTYFAFPAFAQPTHLLLGALAFGALFYLFLQSNFKPAV